MGLLKLAGAAFGKGLFSDIKQASLYTILDDHLIEDALKNGLKSRLPQFVVMFETLETLYAQLEELGVPDTVHILEIDVSACAPKSFVPGSVVGEKAIDGKPIHLAVRRISPEAISLLPKPELASAGPSPR